MRDLEDERNVCFSSTILHQAIFSPLLERLVSALLSWAHFLSGQGYNNDQCPAVLISFVLGKYSGCLGLGREVERWTQTQPLVSPSSGSHLQPHRGGKPQGNKEKQPKEPQSEASYHQALAFGISALCWAKCSTRLYASSPDCTAIVLQLEMEPGVVEQTAPARL